MQPLISLTIRGHSHTGFLNFLQVKNPIPLRGIAVLTLKQQGNRYATMMNEQLPKEPERMSQGAVTQGAQARDPGRPATGATSSSPQAWAP